jgi:hypothetical protein
MWYTPTRLFICVHLAEPSDVTDWRHRVVELNKGCAYTVQSQWEDDCSTTVNLAHKEIRNALRSTAQILSGFLAARGFLSQPDFNIETQTGPRSYRWYVSAQLLLKATRRPWDMSGIKKNTGCSLFALSVFNSEWKLWSTQLMIRWSCN